MNINKRAIFSTLRQYNHYSFKRAAMFGLDARIALAIFGALSVISGAALYSAIQDSKATAILTELQEVGKAWEAFYIDTGVNLKQNQASASNDFFYMLETDQLAVDKGTSGWQGPYLNFEVESYFLKHSLYENVHVIILTDEDTWGDDTIWQDGGKCTTGKKCSIWSYINGIDSIELAKAIDLKVDGEVDLKAGNFRAYNKEDQYTGRFLLKIAPIKNPND